MRIQTVLANLLPYACSLYNSVFYAPCAQKALLNSTTDAFINGILATHESPGGVGIAVVRKDPHGNWNVETRGYGIATANGTRVTEDTIFAIASNSEVQ